MRNCAVIVFALSAVALAADKPAPAAQASSGRVLITATLYQDKDAIRRELGRDLEENFIVVKVELTPRGSKPLRVDWDDFLLRSYKDGQKSGAFAPTQIAGRAALMVSTRSVGAAANADDQGGPTWGGIPGTGERPRRLPSGPGQMVGGGGPGGTETTTSVNTGSDKKPDPLLAVLEEKVLPETETKEPVSGLLYFSLEGKHKPKQIALEYTGAGGKLRLQFR